jgi:type IV pilus assembly protein PilB
MSNNLRDILTRDYGLSAFQMLQAEAFLRNMKAIDLEQNPPEPSACSLVGSQLARDGNLVPVRLTNDSSGSRLIVAIADPMDLSAVDAIRDETGLDVQPVLASPDQLAAILERLYPAA